MNTIILDYEFKIGRVLILLCILGVVTSPPIANLFICITLIWSLLFKRTRLELGLFFQSKIGLAFLGFLLTIIIAPIYGIASNNEIFSSIWGWRKILMLPIASIYFSNSYRSRYNFISFYLIICSIFLFISYFNFFYLNKSGIFLRNYVTQGLVFSIASLILFIKFNHSKSIKTKILYLFLFLIFTANVPITSIGRSSYIALIVLLISAIYFSKKIFLVKKIFYSLSTFALLGVLLFSIPTSRDRIKLAYDETQSGSIQAQETSVGLRITFFKNTLNILEDHIIMGVGTGGFEKAYKETIKFKSGVEGIPTGDPHNQYLKILTEQGILGLIAFITILVLTLTNGSYDDITYLIGSCTLIAWCVTSLANSHFSTFNEGQFIWLWMGVLLTPTNHTRN